MKAKIKETGKVVEVTINNCAMPVQGTGARAVYKGDDGGTYFDTELDFIHVYTDWHQVRIQAAIAAMQAMISRLNLPYGEVDDCACDAVKYADALIEELKKTM